MDSGLYQFHPTTGDFFLFEFITKEGHLIHCSSSSFSIDTTGIVWVGTNGEGLFQMDTRTSGKFTAYNPGGLIPKFILEIYQADGYLWLAPGEGLHQINPRTNQVVAYRWDDFRAGVLSSNAVHTSYKDRLDQLWVGANNGICKAGIYTNSFYTYSPPSILKENTIQNIVEDHNGTIWVGNYEKGLCRIDRKTWRMTTVSVDPADSRNTIESMQWPLLEGTDGRLWVGSDTDKGLHVLDRKTDRFIRYDSKIGVRVLAMAPSGKIWLGGDTGEIAALIQKLKNLLTSHCQELGCRRCM